MCINVILIFRYIVYDLEWENFRKIVLIAYAPDNATDHDAKFCTAANKGKLKNKYKPNLDIQINGYDDLDEEKIKAKF